MVRRPLQKRGGDSPLVSTIVIPLGIVSLILVSYVLNEREREKEREREREEGEGSHRVDGGMGREAWVGDVVGLCWGQTDNMVG